jgi:dGTPase
MRLAPYAANPEKSKGRLHNEKHDPTRNCFQRDRDRIIHSAAFRRLEYKTQVFVNHEGDHYRTRLTHSLEVSQVAKSLARNLHLHEDLAETLALAHDLGHAPFGHAGEQALNDMAKDHGGFDHNANSLRIVTHLESRYLKFDGLNLTWETLEGIVKHSGPIKIDIAKQKPHKFILDYNKIQDLHLENFPSLEAQVSGIADDIAYNNHDIEDGLRASLFTIHDLIDLPLIGEIFYELRKKHPHAELKRITHEAIRILINKMVVDVISNTKNNLHNLNIKEYQDIAEAKEMIVCFSIEMEKAHQELRNFLRKNMYNNWYVNRMTTKAKKVVEALYDYFMTHPESLPDDWRKKVENANNKEIAILVIDYISGMTDRFALQEYNSLFNLATIKI